MKSLKVGSIAAILAAGVGAVNAAVPDMSTVTTGANTLFEGVATLAVTMLVFWVGFRIVRKIKG